MVGQQFLPFSHSDNDDFGEIVSRSASPFLVSPEVCIIRDFFSKGQLCILMNSATYKVDEKQRG